MGQSSAVEKPGTSAVEKPGKSPHSVAKDPAESRSMAPNTGPVQVGGVVVARAGGGDYKPWMPRIWSGITLAAWLRLLARNRFRIAPHRIPMALVVTTLAALVNSPASWAQRLIFGRRIARTKIEPHPIFVVGHWRTGTTFLHELLVADPRHASPTSYQCFAPGHFLVSRSWLGKLAEMLSPRHRPQDDMPFSLDSPQEDEFALCNLGIPSPYWTMAFPNHPPQCQQYIDMEGLTPSERERWKQGLFRFLQAVTYATGKRLVLKSPAHLGRIRVLLELFPQAKFVHIYREPLSVFASTMNLWRRFYRDQGLQRPTYEGLEEYVLETFNRLYRAFERDRPLLGPGQLAEVRFETLVANPLGELERIYRELDLGSFELARPGIEQLLEGRKDYKPNRFTIAEEVRQKVREHWGWFAVKYGYPEL